MNTFFARALLAPADAGASSSTAAAGAAGAASAGGAAGTAAGTAGAGGAAGAAGASGTGAAGAGATVAGSAAGAAGAGAAGAGAAGAASDEDLGSVEAAQGIDATAVEAQKKAADEKKSADVAAQEKAKAAEHVTFKPPEGSPLKAEDVSAWGGLFKDSGLNSEQAQKLVDNYTKLLNSPEAKAAQEKAADDARKQKVAADLVLSKALPKLGGDNYKATIASAKSVLSQYDGGVEVANILKEAGLSANPAFIRFLAAVHAAQQSDSTTNRINPAPPTVTSSKSELERWGNVGKSKK